MKRTERVLASLLLAAAVGCASSEPFHVEAPLSATTPKVDEARAPETRTAPPRPLSVARASLESGMVARVVERPGAGLVTLVYVNRRARLGQDYLPVFIGDALLAGAYRSDGTPVYPVDVAGQTPAVVTGTSGTHVGVTCSAELFDEALEQLAALVLRPEFNPTWMAAVRSRTMLDLLHVESLYWDWSLAMEHASKPFSLDIERMADRLRAMDQQALRQAHRELFEPADSALIVVGDVSAAHALAAFRQKFSSWLPQARGVAGAGASAEAKARTPQPTAGNGSRGRKILVAEDKDYPWVTVIQNAPPPGSADAVAFELLASVLAGHGSSSLMKSLRYQQAHAYQVGARSLTVPESGRFLFIQTAVAAKTLPQDLTEVLRALTQLRTTPVDAQSLQDAKARRSAALAKSLSSGAGIARYLAQTELGDVPTLEDVQAQLQATTAADLQRVAVRYLDPDHATIAVTGAVSEAVAALRGLGEVWIR